MDSFDYYYILNLEDKDYKNCEKIERKIRKLVGPHLSEVQDKLGRPLNIQYWNKRTFGCIFADFPPKKYKKGRSGEKALFDAIKKRFFAVIFSEKLGEEYSDKITISKGEVFVLNLPKFIKLVSLAKKEELVKIFVDRSEKIEKELDKLLEEQRKSGKIHEYLRIEDIKLFVEKTSPQQLDELKKSVPRFKQILTEYKITPENFNSIVNGIVQFSNENKITPENFSKMIDVVMKRLSDKYDLEPESFSKLIDMMGLLSKQYKIKTVPELEKLLDFVIEIFEKCEINRPTDFKRLMTIITKLTPKFEITDPEDLKKILELCRMSDDVIKSNPDYFQKRLAEFKKIIDNPKTLEKDVHKYISDNQWILDFKYWAYPTKKSPLQISKDDFLDLYLEKKNFKTTNAVLVEFKKPDIKLTIDDYRKNKPVIAPEVGKALSQLINYKEKLKKTPYMLIDNFVVLGKKTKESDFFIEVFSTYLHDIEITTYDTLYEKALNVVKAFKAHP